MISQELIDWVERQSGRLNKHFPVATKREGLFGRVAKLTEEVGELAEAILASERLQRQEKLDGASSAHEAVENIGAECADVIITTLLLAQQAGVDINQALAHKTARIDARFEKSQKGE